MNKDKIEYIKMCGTWVKQYEWIIVILKLVLKNLSLFYFWLTV